MHLFKSMRNGSPSAILFAQFALFTATLFVWNTSLYAEHDSTGIKTALSYQIISVVLVSNSKRLSGLGFIHKEYDSKVNSIANLICLILAIVFENFYEKSLSSLGFALSITVLFLILLVIIRPSTDLGLFDFLIGIIGSVAYNLFNLKFQTWIVVAICFPLLGFRCWLDKNCSQKEDDQSLPTCRSIEGRNQISKSEIIEAITVLCFHLFWVYNLFRTNCRKVKGPPESISCTSSPIMGMLACVLIFNLWFGLALIPRVCSLFQTEPAAPFMGRPVGIQENGLGHMVFGAAEQGPGPAEQDPGPEEHGPGPEEHGPKPAEQGAGPAKQRPAKQGLGLTLMKIRPVQPLRHAFSEVGKGVHKVEKEAQKNVEKGVNKVVNEVSKMGKGCKIFLKKTISL